MFSVKRATAVFRKDLIDVVRDKESLVSFIILPLLFSVFIPLIFLLSFKYGAEDFATEATDTFSYDFMMQMLPADLQSMGLPVANVYIYWILTYFIAPMFLVIPSAMASIVSAYSFVSERENKTIEGLLYTPVSASELIAGKFMACLVPTLLLTWLSIIIYAIILATVGTQVLGVFVSLNASWLVMALILSPCITVLNILFVLWVSQKVKTGRAAQGLSSLLILPIVGLITSQVSGFMFFGIGAQLILSLIILILDVIIFFFVVKKVNSERFLINI